MWVRHVAQIRRLVEFFQAISDETRQKILLLLEERERCVGELVREFNLSQPTISNHLLVLKRTGLVQDRREGKQVFYSLNGNLLRDCCAEYFSRFASCDSLFREKSKGSTSRQELEMFSGHTYGKESDIGRG